jgi:hypothetical protein
VLERRRTAGPAAFKVGSPSLGGYAGILSLQTAAGNKAVSSAIAASRRSLPIPVQRACGCGSCGSGGRCTAPERSTESSESAAPRVSSPAETVDDHRHEGGGVCLTCEALRAARNSPGGAIAYVDRGSPPSWRPPVPSKPQVSTAPVAGDENDDGTEATAELVSDLVGEDNQENQGQGVGSPDSSGKSAGRPENLRYDPEPALPPPVMVPVPASAGASVVCKGHNSYEVWQNPSEPAWAQPCETKHEQKHIEDFNADPNYKATVKCPSLPDGETFTYASMADAKRFECAASDVEIACLTDQIAKETDEGNRKGETTRRDVTLPNYKKGFGC